MSSVSLEQGGHYKGTISLGFFEQVASNDMLKSKFEGAGFTDVAVTGSGDTRYGVGVWSKPSQDAELPEQVVKVERLDAPAGPPKPPIQPRPGILDEKPNYWAWVLGLGAALVVTLHVLTEGQGERE